MIHTIGVLSDTHGLLRPDIVDFLNGSDHIIHAGDIGAFQLLEELETIAPVTAVRGNVDYGAWTETLPLQAMVSIAGRRFRIIHILQDMTPDPVEERIDAVIFGHTHQPAEYRKNGILFFNPGSAGHRRFKTGVTAGLITVTDTGMDSRIVTFP